MISITRLCLVPALLSIAACGTPQPDPAVNAPSSSVTVSDAGEAGPARDQTVGIGATQALDLASDPEAINDSGNYGAHTTPGLTGDSSDFERKCKPYCT